ncbi:MAG: GNAT family N-acetyltransferase [Candidatus Bipolaricaulaceae bacterium]
MVTTVGLSAPNRRPAAEVLYAGLAAQLRPVFGPPERAVGVIARGLRGDRVVVATAAGQVIGVCGLNYAGHRFLELGLWGAVVEMGWELLRAAAVGAALANRAGPAEAWVEAVAVAPGWRGQGVGTQLMGAALARLAGCGIRRARLQVAAGNERALPFYQRLEFEVTAFRPLPYPWRGPLAACGAYELARDLSPRLPGSAAISAPAA